MGEDRQTDHQADSQTVKTAIRQTDRQTDLVFVSTVLSVHIDLERDDVPNALPLGQAVFVYNRQHSP